MAHTPFELTPERLVQLHDLLSDYCLALQSDIQDDYDVRDVEKVKEIITKIEEELQPGS